MLQQHPAQLDTVSDLLASLIIQSVYRKIMSDQHHHQPSQQTTMEGKSNSNEVARSNEDASNVADAPEMDTLIDLSDITQPAAASSSPFATVTATSSSSLSVIQQSSSSSSYSSASSSVDDSSSTTSADTIVLTTSYNNDDNENIIDTCSDNNRNNINNENVTTLGDTTDSMDTVTRAFATNLQLLEREVAKLDAEDTTVTAVQVTETTITRGLVATPVGGGKSGDTDKDQTESTAQTPPKIKPYIIFEPSDSEEEVDIPVRLPPHPSDITGKSAATPSSSVPSPKAAQSTVQIGAATPPSSSITIPQSAPLQIGTWRDQTYDADEISSQSYDDDSDDDEISSEDNKSEGLVPRTTTPTNFGSSSSGTAAVAVGTGAGASTSGGGGGGSPSAANLLNLSQEYHLKWIKWKGNTKCPIVTQNSNGPCPLLAIMNVLLMRKNICFPPMIEIITAEQLMDYLCDFILSNVPTNLPEGVKLDFEQNFQDAMSILPRLSTGLDVNVRFTGISDFEYTSECIIFDLLRIPLYHGWLVDPEDSEVFRVVNTLSYNQLVDKIIANKGSADPDINSQMFIAEEFLNQSASQLTNHGLVQLIQRVKEDELCILFRNNHFITLYKYKGKLFQLVTDQGFLTEPNVVWESLNNIEGDTYFVDGDFVLVPPKPAIAMAVTPFVDTQQQIDQDYLIALSLEQEQKQEWERTAASAPDGSTSSTSTSTGSTGQTVLPSPSTSIGKGIVPVDSAPPPRIMSHSSPPAKTTSAISVSKPPLLPVGISDEEMARRLQEEEDQMFQRMQREREQQQQRQRGGVGGGGGVPRQPTQHPQQRYGGGSASTVAGSYSGGLTGGSNRMSSAMSNHYSDSRSSSGQYRTASHHHQGAGGGGTGSATSGASTGASTAHSRHPRSGSGSSASGSATNRPHENDEGNDSNNRSGSSRSNSKNCIIS